MPNPATEARISPIIVSVCDILPTNIVKPTKKTIATKREIILPNVMKIFLTLSSLHKVSSIFLLTLSKLISLISKLLPYP